MSTAQAHITEEQRQQYHDQGYFVLEQIIPSEHLEAMRDECQRYIDQSNAEMDRAGVDTLGLNHRDSRYFISGYKQDQNPKLRAFLFSELMADICRATLGNTAYLFYEQYVVKAAEKGMKFSWHQDSGYVDVPHEPYLTCWCTLDDVTEANGTVYMLPYSEAGTRERVEHNTDVANNDKVGYNGDHPGIPVIVPAGSIACFSSTVFHRSGFNTTDRMRRIYLAQYSPAPILTSDGTPWNLAEPFPL